MLNMFRRIAWGILLLNTILIHSMTMSCFAYRFVNCKIEYPREEDDINFLNVVLCVHIQCDITSRHP